VKGSSYTAVARAEAAQSREVVKAATVTSTTFGMINTTTARDCGEPGQQHPRYMQLSMSLSW